MFKRTMNRVGYRRLFRVLNCLLPKNKVRFAPQMRAFESSFAAGACKP